MVVTFKGTLAFKIPMFMGLHGLGCQVEAALLVLTAGVTGAIFFWCYPRLEIVYLKG